MDRDRIIKLATNVAMISVILLVYWVFVFISITVFGLKVFRENLTETFYLSILGILAILGGTLVVSVVLNLSKIGDALSRRNGPRDERPRPVRRGWVAAFLMTFPCLFALLFLGDYASAAKKRAHLADSARLVIEHNRSEFEQMADYSLQTSYVNTTAEILHRISREEENFPYVSLLIQEEVGGKPTILLFSGGSRWGKDDNPTIDDFIFSCSAEERDYLTLAFSGKTTGSRFSASDGSYELYYPLRTEKRMVVLYCTDRSRYGKIGS